MSENEPITAADQIMIDLAHNLLAHSREVAFTIALEAIQKGLEDHSIDPIEAVGLAFAVAEIHAQLG